VIAPEILDRIDAGMALLPAAMLSDRARVMLYAIGLQESRFEHRRQIVGGRAVGPAKGYWQFERGGGCKGVVTHAASRFWMHRVCVRQNVPFTAKGVWGQVEHDDAFAAVAARLLLFTDPKALPELADAGGAWRLYLRTWRPGKPHKRTWAAFHAAAVQLVRERAES
jgi:hypothetical protein